LCESTGPKIAGHRINNYQPDIVPPPDLGLQLLQISLQIEAAPPLFLVTNGTNDKDTRHVSSRCQEPGGQGVSEVIFRRQDDDAASGARSGSVNIIIAMLADG
jgi:hypothetical protein